MNAPSKQVISLEVPQVIKEIWPLYETRKLILDQYRVLGYKAFLTGISALVVKHNSDGAFSLQINGETVCFSIDKNRFCAKSNAELFKQALESEYQLLSDITWAVKPLVYSNLGVKE
jgi:hypothetical protein